MYFIIFIVFKFITSNRVFKLYIYVRGKFRNVQGGGGGQKNLSFKLFFLYLKYYCYALNVLVIVTFGLHRYQRHMMILFFLVLILWGVGKPLCLPCHAPVQVDL